MIRKDKITLKYSLPWLASLVSVMWLVTFPKIIDWIAQLLGVATPVNAIFFIVIMMILMFMFLISMTSSRDSQRTTRLVQEVALLKKELADQFGTHNEIKRR
jgi:Uncharacterized conserved protein